MTTDEFSNAFDTILNSYSTQIDIGDGTPSGSIALDEYEKSLFLTEAQEQFIIELYTGRNSSASFEETEELRTYLRNLIKTDTPEELDGGLIGLHKQSKFFKLKDDVLFITYEKATISDENAGCKNGSELLIVPVSQDEYDKTINNPFRGLSNKRGLRLDNSANTVEIVSKYNIIDYTIRYLAKPTPIILTDLDEVKINGINTITECKLHSAMHEPILRRAVTLALTSKGLQNRK